MNKLTRTLALLAALAMTATAFVGCGDDKNSSSSSSEAATTVAEESSEETSAAEESSEEHLLKNPAKKLLTAMQLQALNWVQFLCRIPVMH